MELIESNKKKLSKFIKLFKEIKAQPLDTKEELQLEFDRNVLIALTAMCLSQQEGMSEEEITKADNELARLFKTDKEAHEAHE